jgi:hypothetical protein
VANRLSEVYDTFRSISVPEDKTRAAAEALSAASEPFIQLRSHFRITQFKLNVVIGFLVVICLPSLWLLVKVAAKVDALPG